jgi:hypothetical protein
LEFITPIYRQTIIREKRLLIPKMNKLIAYFFCLITIYPFVGKTSWFMWYNLNKNYIANNFCINKNNKEISGCEGCCYLNKQIKKIENKESQSNQNNKITYTIPTLFFEKISSFSFINTHQKIIYNLLRAATSTAFKSQIIKPPIY